MLQTEVQNDITPAEGNLAMCAKLQKHSCFNILNLMIYLTDIPVHTFKTDIGTGIRSAAFVTSNEQLKRPLIGDMLNYVTSTLA